MRYFFDLCNVIRKVLACLFFPGVFILVISCSEKDGELPSFNGEVSEIVFKNCTPCHRNGGPGPFPFTNYEEVKRKAKTIKEVTGSHLMPPWPADTSYSRFIGERFISEKEIALIASWVDAGCPEGNGSPKTYSPPANPKSYLGKPDFTVKMAKPFFIKGNGKDHFALMKMPYVLPADTFLRAVEFVPDKIKLVHHVNGFLIQYDEDKKKNVFEGEYCVDTEIHSIPEGYEMMKLANDDGKTYPLLSASVVNYLPGVWPVEYPEGIGGLSIKKKGAVFFKDIHYGPSAIDTYDSSVVNFYFSPKAPERKILELQLGTLGASPVEPPLVIPPDSIKKFITRLQIPFTISILTVNPHMHLLGKTFKGYAVTPGGDTIPLIRIPKWDFRWQYFYTFKKMVVIPKGSWIIAEGVFDNTRNNPLNPNSPPDWVAEKDGSMRTSDEMFQFIINYLPYKQGDENISLEVKPKK